MWFLATYPKNSALDSQFQNQRLELAAEVFPTIKGHEELAKKAVELREYRLLETSRVQDISPGNRVAVPTDDRPSPVLSEWSPNQVEAFEKFQSLDKQESGEKLRHSFAGMMGRAIEPTIAPLGFDWKIGIGIVASFAAREVFVSTMSTVYNVGNDESDSSTSSLAQTLREQKRPDGTPVYTTLVAVSLMVFYVFAMQCVSTVAVVRRETNSWKWPFIQWLYMGALAWILSFVVYQGGRLLGWG